MSVIPLEHSAKELETIDNYVIYFSYFLKSLLERAKISETELSKMRLKDLNRRLDHIEVNEKKFLMKKRRQLKNIGSAQKTRQRAMCDRQLKESEILELKSKLKSKDEELEKEKEIRLSAEKQKQVRAIP